MNILYFAPFENICQGGELARTYAQALIRLSQDEGFELKFVSYKANSNSSPVDQAIQQYIVDPGSLSRFLDEKRFLFIYQLPIHYLMAERRNNDLLWSMISSAFDKSCANINVSVFGYNTVPKNYTDLLRSYDTKKVVVPNKASYKAAFMKVDGLEVVEPHFKFPSENQSPIKALSLEAENVTFLGIGDGGYKNGLEELVRAYLCEFRHQKDTLLVLKSHGNPNFAAQVKEIRKSIKSEDFGEMPTAKISIINEVLPWNQLSWLYSNCDVYVNTSPVANVDFNIAEALSHRTTVIAGSHSPVKDMTNASWVYRAYLDPAHSLDDSFSPLCWYRPDMLELMACMRKTYSCKKVSRSLDRYGEDAFQSFQSKCSSLSVYNTANQFSKIIKDLEC